MYYFKQFTSTSQFPPGHLTVWFRCTSLVMVSTPQVKDKATTRQMV